MKKFLMLGIITICGFLITATTQANQISYTGNINNNHTVDYFYFTLSGTGSLDLHLETFYGEFDPVMYFFIDDGSLDSSDYIDYDDDAGTPAHLWYNSLIDTSLIAGNYLTAVSDYPLSLPEAVAGSNTINYVDDGGYTLEISSRLGTVSSTSEPVPEPSTILLMGAGLLGLVGFGRKRFSKKS